MATTQTHVDTTTPELPRISGVNIARLYRAIVGPSEYRCTEHVAFVEASGYQMAIDIIAAAVAAIECRKAADVAERIYNCESARELIARGESDDLELRLFETGGNRNGPSYIREPLVGPLFFLDAPAALIRKWSAIPATKQAPQAES